MYVYHVSYIIYHIYRERERAGEGEMFMFVYGSGVIDYLDLNLVVYINVYIYHISYIIYIVFYLYPSSCLVEFQSFTNLYLPEIGGKISFK